MGNNQSTVKLLLAAIIIFTAGLLQVADAGKYLKNSEPKISLNNQTILPGDARKVAVHDAGKLYTSFTEAGISSREVYPIDPETGDSLKPLTYPKGSDFNYVWGMSLWIGGVVDNDSSVTVGDDGWISYREFMSEDYLNGNTYRIGNFADDQFVSTVVDTFTDGGFDPTLLSDHKPLGLEVVRRTYSWSDSLYDDFIIMEYTVTNIQDKNITDGWAGIFLDGDVFHISNEQGYWDDCSGTLEVGLNDDIPARKSLIAYIMDNDGDPVRAGGKLIWTETSPRGAISVRLLEASFDVERINFNWWNRGFAPEDGFGPRQLTKYRPDFFPSGYWNSDNFKYDELSFPEIDFNQLETNLFNTSDGWAQSPESRPIEFASGCDTRFLLSFGPFDLPPGDSVTFAIALVAADNVHVNHDDFSNLYEFYNPLPFEKSLDFSELILHHRRAEQVYKSGLTKPIPGPPQGLAIVEYDDNYVDLSWDASIRPDLGGYNLYYRDKTNNGGWQKFNSSLLSDTLCRFEVPHPATEYELAVSLSDRRHRESGLSISLSLNPAQPHPVSEFSISVIDAAPVLSWTPSVDSANVEFVIYRGLDSNILYPLAITSEHSYTDNYVFSGNKYYYSIAVKNELGFESFRSEVLTAIPMAMNEGILLCDFNGWPHTQTGPFYTHYLETLYSNTLSRLPSKLQRYDRDFHTINEFADNNILIFDSEARWGRIDTRAFEALQTYFDGGGKAIIISSVFYSPSDEPKIYSFPDDHFFNKYLKLDTIVTNPFILDGLEFPGDLMGCASLHSDYEDISADMAKIEASELPICGYIPMTGHLMPTEEAEPIYSYTSSNFDTTHHGAVNGIRYLGDDYQFVLLNFPLTLMNDDEAAEVLLQALLDLGADIYCGDANGDGRVGVGDAVALVHFLFRGGPPPSDLEHSDVDCDGEVKLADAVLIVNYIFRDMALLRCCPN